jgi:rRNA maturation RNase YbeY
LAIRFFCDGVVFKCKNKRTLANWLKQVTVSEGKQISNLNIIFVSDEIILDINRKFLQHDCFTDIITFHDEADGKINGELYISTDTVMMNAKEYNVSFNEELRRVMVHGVLHLCGYKDGTDAERQKMRELENKYLTVIENML